MFDGNWQLHAHVPAHAYLSIYLSLSPSIAISEVQPAHVSHVGNYPTQLWANSP